MGALFVKATRFAPWCSSAAITNCRFSQPSRKNRKLPGSEPCKLHYHFVLILVNHQKCPASVTPASLVQSIYAGPRPGGVGSPIPTHHSDIRSQNIPPSSGTSPASPSRHQTPIDSTHHLGPPNRRNQPCPPLLPRRPSRTTNPQLV